MLVFIAVLSGVVAGVAAGSLTPLLVLRAREQRLPGHASSSVLDDSPPETAPAEPEDLPTLVEADVAAVGLVPESAGDPIDPFGPPLPEPGGAVPPPAWARAGADEPRAGADEPHASSAPSDPPSHAPETAVWQTESPAHAGEPETPATEPGLRDADLPEPPPVDTHPGDRPTQPVGGDLWEGWGQGTFDDLWQPEDERAPLPAALLASVRRGRDRLVGAVRGSTPVDDGPPEDSTGGPWERAALTWTSVRTRVRRVPREQLAVAGMVAVAIIAAVGLGILASRPSGEVVHVTVDRQPQPANEPYLIEVDVPTSPAPTPEPPAATAEPRAAAPAPEAPAVQETPAPVSSGPEVSASASCGTEGINVDYSLSASGADLQWYTLYVDGSPVSGGPLQGTEHSGAYSGEGSPGGHDVELVGTDDSGARSVDRTQVDCPAPA